MKIISLWAAVFPMTFLLTTSRCEPQYVDNSRVFVEGKISGNANAQLPLKISAGNIVITETQTKSDGTFKMGGPGTNSEKHLEIGRKIISYQSNVECKLSYDSTTIVLPSGKSYFKFSNINVAL
ncbi:hypothetical protein [Chryseobacterium sp. R2A-55]|uniref:hypothetical protein n=1 Tax=Chryseobacterium sp. R2A-55 TaxID=2744445 RepID=UPI001F450092|nr:hypothetical protein [Chryseobacterium sp. R2A-55]